MPPENLGLKMSFLVLQSHKGLLEIVSAPFGVSLDSSKAEGWNYLMAFLHKLYLHWEDSNNWGWYSWGSSAIFITMWSLQHGGCRIAWFLTG